MEVHHSVVSPAEVFPWLSVLSSSSSATAAFPSALPYSSSALSPSSTSSRQHTCRKNVPRAFSDSQDHRFLLLSSSPSVVAPASSTSPSNMQNLRVIHSATFAADHRRLFRLLSAENLQSPGSPHVRVEASVGRLSGAIHGGNARKGRVHKRSQTERRQEDSQELEGVHGKEMLVDEAAFEHTDSRMFCDDVRNDYVSDCHSDSDAAPDDYSSSNCTASQLASTSSYDSIHGGFWMNDPYYQEFEALLVEDCMVNRNEGSLINNENMVENSVGNGAALASEYVNLVDSGSAFPAIPTEIQSPMSEEIHKSFKEPVGIAERNAQFNVGHQTIFCDQINRGEVVIRKVESAERPLVSCGSLQNVEVNNFENRPCSGNGEVDERDLEYKIDFKGALTVVDNISEGMKSDTASMEEESIGQAEQGTVAEQVGQVVEQVTELLPDSIKEQMVSVVDQVEKLPEQVSQVAEQVMLKVVDQVTEVLPDPVVEQVGQVAEQVTQTAEQFVEHVTSHVVDPISATASQIVNLLSSDDYDEESDDEFEAYTSLDIPEFKGRMGLNNFIVLQEEQGFLSIIYDFYIFMLKRSLFEFLMAMFAAPMLLSMVFTILYLPQFNGLALDENLREFLQNSDQSAKGSLEGLQLSWQTVFQVFMFSVSLSTGLQPELAPLSPYTLVVANLNALFAQLIFVFLSGAVFARLSQPSQPVKCSTVAIICPPPSNRRLRKEACYRALLTRYVLVGPQPCELVDVKVDLTYHYNTVTRSGTYFRTSQSLKLVRPEIAFLDHGMLVRHIIDETSPLYQRTQGMLEKEDAVFSLSVVGLERSSMQSVFHVQHYCVYDKDVIWDAEFVDMILISKKNRRVVDHSLLSQWRKLTPR